MPTIPNVIKVVAAWDVDRRARPRALFHPRPRALGQRPALASHRDLCFPARALARFVGLPPSPLEKREKLEQLRALEAGMSIAVARVDSVPLSVDTPADLEKARAAARARRTCMTCHVDFARAKTVAFQGEPELTPISPRAKRCRMLDAVGRPTFEDAHRRRAQRRDRSRHHSGGEFAARPHRRHAFPGAPFRPRHQRPYRRRPSNLFIVGEHFHRVRHQLLGVKGAKLEDIKTVYSQGPALGQCRKIDHASWASIDKNWYDTAGAARHIAEMRDPSVAAIASGLAGEIYGLEILKSRCRRRTPQHDALPHHGARARRCAQ